MTEYESGDRIRIDIPHESDPDHHLHGEHGTITSVLRDDADDVTGRDADSLLNTVELDKGDTIDVRGRDVRPPLNE